MRLDARLAGMLPPLPELHIASLVVLAEPRAAAGLAHQLADWPGACVHAALPTGKLVVTLEAASAHEMTAQVAGIQQLPGVLSAALVYQCAEPLDDMNQEMPDAQA